MMPIAHQRKLLLAIALLWATCYGWPTGPPDNDDDVCRTRLPRHGVPPQTSPSPYVITTDATTYQPGSVIRVTIESSSRRNFRGFYIQARLASDTGLVLDDKLQLLSDRALGEFVSPLPQGTKLHSCTQGLKNAVSHSQNTDKSSVTVFWRAPSRPEPWIDQQRYPEPWIGPIRFVATVVESPREIFWTNTYSDIIREDDRIPPVVTCPANVFRTIACYTGGIQVTYQVPTATDNSGTASLVRNTHNVGQFFTVGVSSVTYTYSDRSGNRASCSFTVTVTADDNGLPICTAPDDIQITIPFGTDGTTASWAEPRVTHNCGIVTLQSRSAVPGNFFNVGITRVTYTYVDGSQNRVTCGFNIVVFAVDDEFPVSCTNHPCLNGGTCSNAINGFECNCLAGWIGVRCEIHGIVCANNQCQNGGVCMSSSNGYTCQCIGGWTGFNCESGPCASQPCEFGICYNRDAADGGYECACQNGYSGTNCDDLIRSCDSQPCVNGICYENIGGSYACVCEDGYSGVNCQIDIEPPVVDCNGATITEFATNAQGAVVSWLEPTATDNSGLGVTSVQTHGPGSFFPVGFTDVTYTFTDRSGNNAACFFRVLVMSTPPPIDECARMPCMNGGTCMNSRDNTDGFICICPLGFLGPTCRNQGPQVCRNNPCSNGGTCIVLAAPGGIVCNCPPGFFGDSCEIGPCFYSPCLNGGSCQNIVGRGFAGAMFACSCDVGFTGDRCEFGDPCVSSPCLNGGSCKVLLDNGFVCDCTDGFEGDRCETREMTLDLNPTQMEEFQNNFMDVMNNIPDGMTLEGMLSKPDFYNRSVVPNLTEAQIDMIMEEYGDIFINEQDVIDEIQGGQGRRRRQSMSMSQRICPVEYVTRTNLVSIRGNDRSTPNENAQLVQVNNMIQWAFNAECKQTACRDVQPFEGALLYPCTCEEEKHTVTALVYNIQAGPAVGYGSLSITLKQIDVYTCDGKI